MLARTRSKADMDHVLLDLMRLGFAALVAWALTGVVGTLSGYLTVQPSATLRFLLSVLILVFARRTYWELREWRWRKLPADDRFGFSSPLSETPRSNGWTPEPSHDVDEEVTGAP